MDFNTIYFFEYQKKGDITAFKKSIKINEIHTLLTNEDIFTMKWTLKELDYELHFKHSWEYMMWLEGI